MEFLASLAPKPFSGRSTEDADLWLGKFKTFARFHNLTDARTSDLFSLCLQGDAEIWHEFWSHSQPTENHEFHAIQQAFEKRFFSNHHPTKGTELLKALTTRKQKERETASQFITDLKMSLKYKDFPKKYLVGLAMNGLRPNVRKLAYLVGNSETLDEVEDHAIRAEFLEKEDLRDKQDITPHEKRNRLCEQITKLQDNVQFKYSANKNKK